MSVGQIAIRTDIEPGLADRVAGELDAFGSGDEVVVSISSAGGSCFEAVAVSYLLTSHPAKIIARVESLAASAATIVAAAADEIEIFEPGVFMVHRSMSGFFGNRNDASKLIEILDLIDLQLAKLFSNRAGGSVQNWLRLLDSETYFDSGELQAVGIADRIIPSKRGGNGQAMARAAMGAKNRTALQANIIDGLKNQRRPEPAGDRSLAAFLSNVAARAADVHSTELGAFREANKLRIVANAPERRAKGLLRLS